MSDKSLWAQDSECIWCSDTGIVWVRVGEDDYEKDACTACDKIEELTNVTDKK